MVILKCSRRHNGVVPWRNQLFAITMKSWLGSSYVEYYQLGSFFGANLIEISVGKGWFKGFSTGASMCNKLEEIEK